MSIVNRGVASGAHDHIIEFFLVIAVGAMACSPSSESATDFGNSTTDGSGSSSEPDGSGSSGTAEVKKCADRSFFVKIEHTATLPRMSCIPGAPTHLEEEGLRATTIDFDCIEGDTRLTQRVRITGYWVDFGSEPVEIRGINQTYDSGANSYYYEIRRGGILAMESNWADEWNYLNMRLIEGDEACGPLYEFDPAQEHIPLVLEGTGPDGEIVHSELGSTITIMDGNSELLAQGPLDGPRWRARVNLVATEILVPR